MIYTPLADLPPRQNGTGPAAKAGQLLFPWRAHQPKLDPHRLALSVDPRGWGYMIIVDREAVEPLTQPRHDQFEQLLGFYLGGGAVPPNFEAGTDETLDRDLDMIACGAGMSEFGGVSHLRLPGAQLSTVWCRAFAPRTQAGQLTGEALLLIYRGQWKADATPRTARFKLCDHQPVTGASARPERGWHPSSCPLCGLNLSVDSGD